VLNGSEDRYETYWAIEVLFEALCIMNFPPLRIREKDTALGSREVQC
jgi:hypothetical protein